jgi:hypothetical protein
MLDVSWAAIEIMTYEINYKNVIISVEQLNTNFSAELNAGQSQSSTKYHLLHGSKCWT